MRAERMSQQQAAHGRQQERVAQLQRFIDRFKAKASKAKQAQSRVKALARMETHRAGADRRPTSRSSSRSRRACPTRCSR